MHCGGSSTARAGHPGPRLARYGHGALRNPGRRRAVIPRSGAVVRRALAYGIDRVAIARESERSFGERERVSRWTAPCSSRTARYYRPNWKRLPLHDPLRRGACSSRRAAAAGPDGIYACAGKRLSLRFVTIAGRRVAERTLELVQAQLRRVGIEVDAQLRRLPRSSSDQILATGDFDVALFGVGSDASIVGALTIFGCGQRAELHRLLPAARHRATSTRRRAFSTRRSGARPEPLDARLAKDVPVIPLVPVRRPLRVRCDGPRLRLRRRRPLRLWDAENWWLAS